MALSDAIIATIRYTQEPRSQAFHGIYSYADSEEFDRRSGQRTRFVIGSYCCYASMLDPEALCGCEKPDKLETLAALGLVQLMEQQSLKVDLKDLR